MALARCETCGRPSGRGGNVYAVTPYHPKGHPNSGVVCGRKGCENAGVVWLLTSERKAFMLGTRVFELPSNGAKIRLADSN